MVFLKELLEIADFDKKSADDKKVGKISHGAVKYEYPTSGPRGLNFDPNLHLPLYFVHARSEGSGEPVHIVQVCPSLRC